jgi:hypothetical protein
MEKRNNLLITLVIVLGFIICSIILGRSVQRFKTEDRTVSVKGFSEREVKSDLVVWTIRTRVAGNDLAEASKSIEEAKNKVIEFLLRNNIKPEDITQKDLFVNDKKAQEYVNQIGETYRFIVDKIIQVRSGDVDNVQKVSRMTDELLKAGVVLSTRNEFEGPVMYYFTKLNEIKPDMLSEVTRNAREAADKFAKESNTRLGALRKATQGLFTIVDRDNYVSGQAEYGRSGSDLYKKVRVVVNMDYSIR